MFVIIAEIDMPTAATIIEERLNVFRVEIVSLLQGELQISHQLLHNYCLLTICPSIHSVDPNNYQHRLYLGDRHLVGTIDLDLIVKTYQRHVKELSS